MYNKMNKKIFNIFLIEYKIDLSFLKIVFFALIATYLFMNISNAFAAGYQIPGNDQSKNLTEVNDFVSTIIGLAKNLLAPALAFVCVASGVHRCAKRKSEEGIPLIIGGAGLMFIDKVMSSISKMIS